MGDARPLGFCLCLAVATAGFSAPKAWEPPVWSRFDSLFIIAATGEPRFARERDSCERLLIAADTATLDYLIRHRLENQTARQRHYVRHLFAVLSDSGRNAAPRNYLARALPESPDSIRAQLLYIGSRLGDARFARAAFDYLDSGNEAVRRNAMRCLGAYPAPGHPERILRGMGKIRGLELHQRLWALAQHDSLFQWKEAAFALGDSLLCNRQAARRIVAKSAASWKDVEPVLDRLGVGPLEGMLLAEQMGTPGALRYRREALARLDPASRRFLPSDTSGGSVRSVSSPGK